MTAWRPFSAPCYCPLRVQRRIGFNFFAAWLKVTRVAPRCIGAPHEHAPSRCAGSPRPIRGLSWLLNGPARRDVGATRETAADFLRPLLRAVQDAYNVNDLAGDLVDHDIRKRRKYEFARPLFLTRTPAVWERQQRGGGVVDSAHQFGCSLRRVLILLSGLSC